MTASAYYLAVFLSGAGVGAALGVLKRPFARLATRTLGLLDALLDDAGDEDAKHARVVRRLGAEVVALAAFAGALVVPVAAALLPLYAYAWATGQPLRALDTSSVGFWAVFGLATLAPFVPQALRRRRGEADGYTWSSKLLHELVLSNYNVARKLYRLERAVYGRRASADGRGAGGDEAFVVVSGLARAGTTAFTQMLHAAGRFHALSYAHMPFLLAPNLWKHVYDPDGSALRERSHGDAVLFGLASIEALEEPFFKVFLNDAYVAPDALVEHAIPEALHAEYRRYRALVALREGADGEAPPSRYLAKNNNLLLRYRSLRAHDPHFHALFLFRDPVEHAHSLLKQHRRFTRLHDEDPFALAYMDWLGHHEFGRHHKPFRFGPTAAPAAAPPPEGGDGRAGAGFEEDDLNYWLGHWVAYYETLLEVSADPNLHLIAYRDLLRRPAAVLRSVAAATGCALDAGAVEPFDNPPSCRLAVDVALGRRAYALYARLDAAKLPVGAVTGTPQALG